jgi:hypothetical protein
MEITIKLSSENTIADLTIAEQDGAVSHKQVTVEDIRNVFSEIGCSEYWHPLPALKSIPQKFIPGLIVGKKTQSSAKGLFFIPGEVRYMNFAGEKFMCPYPSLLFFLSTLNGKVCDSRCLATDAATILDLREDTPLYAFPFGNVYPHDAHICWGTNSMNDVVGYEGMSQAITTFFSSESNMDYVQEGKSFRGAKTYAAFLQRLKALNKFPKRYLVPSEPFPTLKKLLSVICDDERREN